MIVNFVKLVSDNILPIIFVLEIIAVIALGRDLFLDIRVIRWYNKKLRERKKAYYESKRKELDSE